MYLSTCRLLLATALCWLTLVAPAAAAPKAPPVTCRACLLIDDSGRILASRSPNLPLPNASTTKMVTAILVVREAEPDEVVTVSPFAAGTGEAGLDLATGDRYRVAELLYGLLLTSSNDAAVALAEHVSGSEPAFVAAMNDYVGSLGLSHTHFVTAHGLDRPDHYASASDLAVIGRELLARPELARIVRTPSISIRGELLENRNLLLESYRGAIGVKTGMTLAAGNVLVAAAERRGRTLIAVVMDSVDSFRDSAALLDYGFAVLRRTVVIEEGSVVGDLVFDSAGAVPVMTTAPVRGLFSADRLTTRVVLDEQVGLPVAAGDTVGRAVYRLGGRKVAEVPLQVGAELDASGTSWLGSLLAGLLALLSLGRPA